MTKQEMFDKAVRGLAKQCWKRAARVTDIGNSICVYQDKDGNRCAWGHVDTSLDSEVDGGVRKLHEQKIGLAAGLTDSEVMFAQILQTTHDDACTPEQMLEAYTDIYIRHQLDWPSDVERFGVDHVVVKRTFL
jgi:hypothetical protein